ncbi:MAG: alpha/beta hydrolase [archaeon]|nr:MAG: alpha/beta hydrolase [archaeon]
MPKIQLADATLHYVESGAGQTVVLVHGGLADYRLWGVLSGALSPKFKVISYSRRGAFPNEAPQKDASGIPMHSADLAALISQLSEGPVHLVGESYGAYVAAHCALHNPDKVRSLAIDEPPILPLLMENDSDRAELEHFENDVLKPVLGCYKEGKPEDAARALLGFLEGSRDVYDSLPGEIKEAIMVNSGAMFEDLKGGFDGIKREEVAGLNAPTLLMKSELGPPLLKRVVDHLHLLVPKSAVTEIAGTSHGTIVDSPAYCACVLGFLSQF